MLKRKQILQRMEEVLRDRAENSTSTSIPAVSEGKGDCI